MTLVRSAMSPASFDRDVVDHQRACEWYQSNVKPEIELVSIDNLPKLELITMLASFPQGIEDRYVLNLRDELSELLIDYTRVRQAYLAANSAAEVSSWEEGTRIILPFIISIATALALSALFISNVSHETGPCGANKMTNSD
ncbi:hypothetical protein [Acuticoccus mangrovi]|uniref:Uncharacterized protein n=1 Tax=Acuticoccus mangrovi TaxID=2796142 RepID=A0A934IH82_9HYPH|nr:hypothetical protein [Acuticoccus mangrovi]MBJ3776418.1 hypothetical protein [Acuticoccus mangrovi]